MENLITILLAVVLMAPFLWPAFVMIYRYFRDLEDQEREEQPTWNK